MNNVFLYVILFECVVVTGIYLHELYQAEYQMDLIKKKLKNIRLENNLPGGIYNRTLTHEEVKLSYHLFEIENIVYKACWIREKSK